MNEQIKKPEAGIIVASKKRIFLCFYIDLLFMMTLASIMEHLIGKEIPFMFQIAITGALFGIIQKFIGYVTPGARALGVRQDGTVDPDIFQRETRLTIFAGVLSVLEGTKSAVRWTQFETPWPYFGILPEGIMAIASPVLLGVAFIASGLLILNMRRIGVFLAMALSIFGMISAWMSRGLWMDVIAKKTVERRTIQDIPVREGEIEFMQAVLPNGVLIFYALLLIFLVLSYKRFRA